MVVAVILLSKDMDPLARVCAVPVIVRLLRALHNANIRDIVVLNGEYAENIRELIGSGEELGLNIRYNLEGVTAEKFLVLTSRVLVDEKLIEELAKSEPNTIFITKNNGEEILVGALIESGKLNEIKALFENDGEEKVLGDLINVVYVNQIKVYYPHLRRHLNLLAIPVRNDKERKRAAKVLVARTQKGLHIFGSINRYFENAVVRLVCNCSWITPNRVTILSNITAYLMALLFTLQKPFLAIIMGFVTAILDGVDGKLARVRGIGTKLGEIEHSFDMLYEQVIYVAWIYYVYTITNSLWILIMGFIFLVSDTFTRHVYMQFKMSTGKNLLLMSRIDRIIAKIDGRRNMWFFYMLIGILTKPYYGLILMLVHSLATSTVYITRAIYHLRRMDKEEGTKAWLNVIYNK